MGTPQDPRVRRREKARRARKELEYAVRKAAEADAAQAEKKPAATVATSAR